MALVKNIFHGLGSVLELSPQPRRYRIELHGSWVDAQRLRGDFLHIGRDMARAVKSSDPGEKTSAKITQGVVVRALRAQTLRKLKRRGVKRG
jgi:hypothetical protein